MLAAIEQFRTNLTNVKHLGALHSSISPLITPALDLSDLLRAELVFAVSALDKYVHDLVRLGMLEIFDGHRAVTPAYDSFVIPMGKVQVALALSSPDSTWLEEEIVRQHAYRTFQAADKVAEAVRLISTVPLWDTLAKNLGWKAADLKTELNLIVERRNKIAHESDLDPSSPGARWPINTGIVDNAVTVLSDIAEEIYRVV